MMREVSKAEFYGPIYEKRLNVHPYLQPGPYPYISIWKYMGSLAGKVYGKSDGTKYFLRDDWHAPNQSTKAESPSSAYGGEDGAV